MLLATHGIVRNNTTAGYGALTTAWITATGETDTTIISALNTLETDLTTYGLTSKIKALYPMVGGSSTKHKFNFMDARDLDAAFRLTFNGGWTHSSTGALPNGVNAYADTKFNALTNFPNTIPYGTIGIGYYSRTNSNGVEVEFGASNNVLIEIRTAGTTYGRVGQNGVVSFTDADSFGFYNFNRLDQFTEKGYKNGILKSTVSASISTYPNLNVYLGAWNPLQYYSTKECAFASIGDGLTDGEAANFYTAVQAFQTTLSRQIVSYGALTTAWITATSETDTTIISALNTLETDLTTYGLTSKIKALYPMVGGTAAKHKFNFMDARDLDAAYRLTFNGGWTHASTGALPSGVNSHADTNFNSNILALNSSTLLFYTTTNSDGVLVDMGNSDNVSENIMLIKLSSSTLLSTNSSSAGRIAVSNTDSRGLYLLTRTASNVVKYFKNSSLISSSSASSLSTVNRNIWISAWNNVLGDYYRSPRNVICSAMADGLNDTESANLSNAINTFNTTLTRNTY